MTRTLHRATRAVIALSVAALLSGCYTASPSPKTSRSGVTPHGHASYGTPSGSVGISIFTSPPRTPGNDGSIWYYGNHPHPANHALGRFCSLSGSHRHDYAPYNGHRYAHHDGHYFWVGDAKPYARRDHSYAYHGHHPHPHYFGGTCRIHGLHQHAYAPISADYYRLKNGAYFYTGVYESDYYAERDRYDARGWKRDHRARGYHEHEHTRAEEQAASSPHRAAGASAPMDAHRVTPRELVERMRERTQAASESAPANSAAD